MADNSLAVRGNQELMSFDDIAGNALDSAQYALPTTSSDPYLRMSRTGEWVYGAEDFEVEEGSKWAINPLSVQIGFVCWTRNEPGAGKNTKLGEVMVPANRPMPNKSTLPEYQFPWTEQVSFLVACVSGEDKGMQTKYATTSVGGIGEVRNHLLKEISAKIKSETARGATRETAEIVPIVTLDKTSYNHPQYKKIFTPIFKIVAWATLDGNEVPAEKAKPNGKPVEAHIAAEAVEADAPRRRRARA